MDKKIIFWLDRIILVLIGAGIFFAPFKVHWVKILLISGMVCLVVKKAIGFKLGVKPLFKSNFLNKPMLVFLLSVFAAIVFSGDFHYSQKIFFSKTFFYAGIFFLIKETIDSREKIRIIFSAIILSAFAVGIDSVIQFFTGVDLFSYLKSNPGTGGLIALTGPFGYHNSFSGYLEIVLPLIIFLCFVPTDKIFRVISFFVALMLLLCWIYVFQRTTWLSVTLSIFMISFLFKRKIALLFFGAVLITTALFFPAPAWQRIFKGEDSNRFTMWKSGIQLVVKKPVFGNGLGAYSRYNTQTRDLHAHNTYLEVFIDTGIVGLSGFLYLLGLFLVKTFSALRAVKEREKKIILAGLSASCLSTFISALFCTNLLVGIGQSALFWIMFSLASVAPSIKFDEVAPNVNPKV